MIDYDNQDVPVSVDFLAELFCEWKGASSPFPFVVSHYETTTRPVSRHYHFWFFGYVARLPFERDLSRGTWWVAF